MNPAMNICPAGVAFIKNEEGLVLHPYPDHAGISTIGYGHARWTGGDITEAQADELLAHDLLTTVASVNKLVTWEGLTQNMFDALCSFVFNCGAGALQQSTTLRLLNAGDTQGAADALLLWNKIVDPKTGQKAVDAVLDGRRHRERAFFLAA